MPRPIQKPPKLVRKPLLRKGHVKQAAKGTAPMMSPPAKGSTDREIAAAEYRLAQAKQEVVQAEAALAAAKAKR